jgi:hypothetical protein
VSNVGLVSLTGAGTCTVVASQGGNASFNAAPNVEHAITVGKATPTITWSNPTAISYPTALRGCYEPVRRMPAACWRKRQANATK